MLHDVKLRTFDRVSKLERIEIVTVDAGGGDAAAEMAQALRPAAMVVGVTPKGGFGPVGGASLEAEDTPADDEDAEPGPSNRERAMMTVARRTLAAVAIEQSLPGDQSLIDRALADAPVKRGPGRPRKEPQS